MRKRLSVLLAAIASMILILTLLFTAVQIGINDHTFINNKYSELGLARRMGMSNADLVNSCIRLIDYMQGKAESIDIEVTVNGEKTLMFDQPQEIQHMKDVRQLYQTCSNTGIWACSQCWCCIFWRPCCPFAVRCIRLPRAISGAHL